jgi:hypothetical protein
VGGERSAGRENDILVSNGGPSALDVAAMNGTIDGE